jgi:signal peptidase
MGSNTKKSVIGPLKIILQFLGVLVLLFLVFPASWGGTFGMTVVSGHSMNPTYTSGDTVISMRQANYAVGDIIVYHPADLCPKCNVVHRIIGGNAQAGWITQGDNNPSYDQWRPKGSMILGHVILHIPTANASRILFSPFLWFTLIAMVLAALLFIKAKEIKDKEKEITDSLDENHIDESSVQMSVEEEKVLTHESV